MFKVGDLVRLRNAYLGQILFGIVIKASTLNRGCSVLWLGYQHIEHSCIERQLLHV